MAQTAKMPTLSADFTVASNMGTWPEQVMAWRESGGAARTGHVLTVAKLKNGALVATTHHVRKVLSGAQSSGAAIPLGGTGVARRVVLADIATQAMMESFLTIRGGIPVKSKTQSLQPGLSKIAYLALPKHFM